MERCEVENVLHFQQRNNKAIPYLRSRCANTREIGVESQKKGVNAAQSQIQKLKCAKFTSSRSLRATIRCDDDLLNLVCLVYPAKRPRFLQCCKIDED